jgi:citrate synthase
MAAHSCSASNNPNASTAAAVNSYCGSRSINHAICSAILSTGTVHGPVTDARMVFAQVRMGGDPLMVVDSFLNAGLPVPGFGNSFFKDQIDPCWEEVNDLFQSDFPTEASAIAKLRWALGDRKKPLHPNAAMFTGAAAWVAGFPVGTEPALFIIPRIGAWVQASIQ